MTEAKRVLRRFCWQIMITLDYFKTVFWCIVQNETRNIKQGIKQGQFWFHVDFCMPQDQNPFSRLQRLTGKKTDTKRLLFCKHESELLTDTAVKNLRLWVQLSSPISVCQPKLRELHINIRIYGVFWSIQKTQITSVHDQAIKAGWLLRHQLVHSCWILKGKCFIKQPTLQQHSSNIKEHLIMYINNCKLNPHPHTDGGVSL